MKAEEHDESIDGKLLGHKNVKTSMSNADMLFPQKMRP